MGPALAVLLAAAVWVGFVRYASPATFYRATYGITLATGTTADATTAATAAPGGDATGASEDDPAPAAVGAPAVDRATVRAVRDRAQWFNVSLLALAAGAVVVFVRTNPRFRPAWPPEPPPATPGAIGAIRALTCGVLLISALWEDLPSTALLPPEMRVDMGVIKLLYHVPGFAALVDSGPALAAWQRTTIALLVLGVVGLGTRFVVPAAAVGYLVLAGLMRHYTWFYHTGLVPLYVLVVLCFARNGDGFSLDRLVRVWRGRAVPDADRTAPHYAWARYAVWVVVVLPYVMAGASKIRRGGWLWWNADNFRRYLYGTTLMPMEFSFDWALRLAYLPDAFFAALGMAGVFGELLFGLVLLWVAARVVLPLVMAVMHVGIFFLQNILFFDLILLQAVFYDWRGIRLAAGRWLAARRGRYDVLYDGRCPFCRRTVAVLRGLDLLDRLTFVDFRRLDLNAYNAEHRTAIAAGDLEHRMYVTHGGRAWSGFHGFRQIAGAVPLAWPVAPLLYLPGAAAAGVRAYDLVARNRLKLVCDDACPIEFAPPAVTTAAAPEPVGQGRGPVVVAAMVGVLAVVWLGRTESFPLTSMQMFSGNDRSRVVDYYKIVAELSDGRRVRAYPEQTIGAMADARYRQILRNCFGREREPSRRFLAAYAAAYNRTAPPDHQIVRLEVQRWQWDFARDPAPAEYGQIVDRLTHAVGSALAGGAPEPLPENESSETPVAAGDPRT